MGSVCELFLMDVTRVEKNHQAKMILVAGGVVVNFIQQYCVLMVRFLALAVRAAPLPRRVRQIILRRILTDPLQT